MSILLSQSWTFEYNFFVALKMFLVFPKETGWKLTNCHSFYCDKNSKRSPDVWLPMENLPMNDDFKYKISSNFASAITFRAQHITSLTGS
jgi:hypothetical protein